MLFFGGNAITHDVAGRGFLTVILHKALFTWYDGYSGRFSISTFWAGRKNAFGAVGRISPEFYVQDGVVPRTRLPYVLRRVSEICDSYNLKVGNVLHAGDGNLHPLILFDSQIPGEVERVRKTGREILQVCAEVGGSITGEHGVGMEKQAEMAFIFSDVDSRLYNG